MLDMVFAVDDPEHWHAKNLQMNWKHYSSARRLGPRGIARIQRSAAGVYYNPLIEINNQVRNFNREAYHWLCTWAIGKHITGYVHGL